MKKRAAINNYISFLFDLDHVLFSSGAFTTDKGIKGTWYALCTKEGYLETLLSQFSILEGGRKDLYIFTEGWIYLNTNITPYFCLTFNETKEFLRKWYISKIKTLPKMT